MTTEEIVEPQLYILDGEDGDHFNHSIVYKELSPDTGKYIARVLRKGNIAAIKEFDDKQEAFDYILDKRKEFPIEEPNKLIERLKKLSQKTSTTPLVKIP